MSECNLPEPNEKFSPEQRRRLGQVYTLILRWNREDELALQSGATSIPEGEPVKKIILSE